MVDASVDKKTGSTFMGSQAGGRPSLRRGDTVTKSDTSDRFS